MYILLNLLCGVYFASSRKISPSKFHRRCSQKCVQFTLWLWSHGNILREANLYGIERPPRTTEQRVIMYYPTYQIHSEHTLRCDGNRSSSNSSQNSTYGNARNFLIEFFKSTFGIFYFSFFVVALFSAMVCDFKHKMPKRNFSETNNCEIKWAKVKDTIKIHAMALRCFFLFRTLIRWLISNPFFSIATRASSLFVVCSRFSYSIRFWMFCFYFVSDAHTHTWFIHVFNTFD